MFKPKIALYNGVWWVINFSNVNPYGLTYEETIHTGKAFVYCKDKNDIERRW